MSSTNPNNATDNAVKLSMRIDRPLWNAWKALAEQAKYDPTDYIKMMMIRAVTKAEPPVLAPEESERLNRFIRLIDKAVEIARQIYHEDFTPDITLRVFQRAMQDEAFSADYKAYIGGGDPYVHGNPLKEINRELGFRIKNSIDAEVVKDENGNPVEKRNLKGEVIQSYTLLRKK